MTVSPLPSRTHRLVAPAIGVAAIVVLVLAIITAAVRGDHDSGSGSSPGTAASPSYTPSPANTVPSAGAAATAAQGYYVALSHDQVHAAYDLLCSRDRAGFSQYAAMVALNKRTGTAIASFRLTGDAKVVGQAAGVPGHIALANGQTTPIIVLLVAESGSWRVCSSNLGGILPAPGTTTGASPSPTGSGSSV